jgi:phosphosulfolactate phosphohydrolase-like enzyme
MISLVTAVVSDNVIQATQDRKEKQKEAGTAVCPVTTNGVAIVGLLRNQDILNTSVGNRSSF